MKRFLLAIVVLLSSMVPTMPSRAQQGTKIAFLNPSAYSNTMRISDKQDANQTAHLVAWVDVAPSNPLVEFEVEPVAAGAPQTLDASRAGVDTWEASMSLSGLVDGAQYTLRARLFANFGTASVQEVAVTEEIVTVEKSDLPPPASNTVEITWPTNAGALGTFQPKGGATNTLIEGVASSGTRQVRLLYTTSAPGAKPSWTACGSAAVTGDNVWRGRCTLEAGAAGGQVRAVAAVANDTPSPGTPTVVADATGDAHRVLPYSQTPGFVSLNPEAAQGELATCTFFVAQVLDERARPIAGANVDVHATGPDDQIQFGVKTLAQDPTAPAPFTSGFKAPDSGHVSTRATVNCHNGSNNSEIHQGDHNIPGQDDPQHIESTSGTNNSGEFTFALHSVSAGGTQIVAWADVNDDDQFQVTETGGGARLGWGQAPPAPTNEVVLQPRSSSAAIGECLRLVMVARQGGNALPGANVDVHATDPPGVSFCIPDGGGVSSPPDAPGHVDEPGTIHIEGTADSRGTFVFGVRSPSEGITRLAVWLDSTNDDVRSPSEAGDNGTISWALSGERSISIASGRSRVRKGRQVAVFGQIDASSVCAANQTVKIRAKPVSGGRFRTIRSTLTDADGDYRVRVKVRKSKRYFAVSPAEGPCERTRSRRITIKVRN